jgi:hypothetical protein
MSEGKRSQEPPNGTAGPLGLASDRSSPTMPGCERVDCALSHSEALGDSSQLTDPFNRQIPCARQPH